MEKFSVLIVGAGPVGLTLALDLKQKGIDVLVVEQRRHEEPSSARCNTVASRTMEIWRKLGVADRVRAAGLTDDYPGDVVWATRMHGHEIARLPLASRATRFLDMTAADAAWPTCEPVHRASQYCFDPILRNYAEEQGVPFLDATSLSSYEQDENGVIATVSSVEDGSVRQFRCRFLVGCDGGRSTVRKQMRVKFSGDAEIFRMRSRLIRAPWMRDHMKGRPGWMNWFLGPGPIGASVAINGTDLWLIHVNLPYGVEDFEQVDFDRSMRQMLALEPHHQYEILSGDDWIARRFVADSFRDRRVLLCGDAAHIWVPFAGYGMNAGVADAENLAWTLAAYLQGWGGGKLVDAYEAERRPVTEQVSRFAMDKALEYVNGQIRNTAPALLDEDGLKGQALRDELGQRVLAVNIPQFACSGLNYGYYYESSPVVAYDEEAAPEYGMDSYLPSTVPGCRLPHFWLPNGTSLYDLTGPWFTLLRFNTGIDVSEFMTAASKRNIPVKLLDLGNPDRFLFKHGLTLARPDRHVAWRGDCIPADYDSLLDLVSGHAP